MFNTLSLSSDPNKGWPLSAWPQFYIIDQNMIILDEFKGFYAGLIESIIQTSLETDTGSP